MTAVARPAMTVVELAHARAEHDPDRLVFTALHQEGGAEVTLTAGELDRGARELAARLLAVGGPGERVLVPAMPGLGFQVAVLACLYAGLVAVPTPPIRSSGRTGTDRYTRLVSICQDCAPAAMVLPGALIEQLATAWSGLPGLASLRLVPVEPGVDEPLPHPRPAAVDDLAILQYTSGSTAAPRGVMLSHRALAGNQEILRGHLEITRDTTMVSWLPTYHDMGLCLGLLNPLYLGGRSIVMPPEAFVLRPARWLNALSGLPDAMSSAPDFGYAWCVRRIRPTARAGLDLSGWRVAVNGAEPVRPDTVRDFYEAFAGCGLSDRTLTPAYGLAESTLFVSGGTGTTPAESRRYKRGPLAHGRAVAGVGDHGTVELASLGVPGAGVELAIVDPDSREALPERRVGELWVRSLSNGDGYWGQPELSREIFGARLADEVSDRGWLRTGDLGFRDDTDVFVTGRRKDLMVIHGANFYPADFERLATSAHAAFAGELSAAFADGDRVTVVVETSKRGKEDVAEAAVAAVRVITEELPVGTDVLVVPRGQIPRTTSGKPRRQACASRLADRGLTILASWPRTTDGAA